jgi:hypothetical protein
MPCSSRISWIEYETGQFRRAIVARRHPRPWQAVPDDPGQVFVRHGPPEAAAQHRDARHLVAAVAVARRAPRAEQQRPALHISRIVFADVHLRRRQGGHHRTEQHDACESERDGRARERGDIV